MMITWLPHLDAGLNLLATCLLVCGYTMIRLGREPAHRRLMISAFVVSTLFLIAYVTYHAQAPPKRFPPTYPGWISAAYRLLLLSHIVLAATVPFLAGTTLWLGLSGRRATHRRWARWTFPIWLYVSVSGVLVYLCLYWWFT